MNRRREEELLLWYCDPFPGRPDLDRVRWLVLTEGINVNCVGELGETPLMRAARRGHLPIARFLLQHGANVDTAVEDGTGRTALVYAFDVSLAMSQFLIEHGASVETRFIEQGSEYSLLAYAIYQEMVEMVRLLLRFGANTQETFYDGRTYPALYLACWHSTSEIVQLLIDHDDDVDVNTFVPRDGDSPAMSPLCEACERINLEMVQLLIQNGARVVFDGVYPDVPCPLKCAAGNWGSLELLRILLDHSRFLGPANEENAQVPEIVGDNHPLSPALEAAIECNNLEAAQLLVDRGANVNDRAFCFLHHLARDGLDDEGRVGWLLRAGANVNLADPESGQTPLWAAAETGNEATVKMLLEARADVRIRDNGGEKPLEVARRNGHKRIVYLLLRTSPHVWRKLEPIW